MSDGFPTARAPGSCSPSDFGAAYFFRGVHRRVPGAVGRPIMFVLSFFCGGSEAKEGFLI